MSEADPKFSDPVQTSGRSRIWLPILAVLFLFLITAAAAMLIGSLVWDADASPAPAAPPMDTTEAPGVVPEGAGVDE